MAIAGAAGTAAYLKWIRLWHTTWGATPEEVSRVYPCDDVFVAPEWNATRAVTVAARPEQIWPFLVQISWGRAGWYSYDWVYNGGRPSTWELLPEHQWLEAGKDFPMSPLTAVYCKDFDELRWMLWRTGDEAGTWLWYLDSIQSMTSTRG